MVLAVGVVLVIAYSVGMIFTNEPPIWLSAGGMFAIFIIVSGFAYLTERVGRSDHPGPTDAPHQDPHRANDPG